MLYQSYALLDENDRVTYIGTKADVESSERGLTWVGIPQDENVKIGLFYDFYKQQFVKKYLPLPEERRRLLDMVIRIYRDKMGSLLKDYDVFEVITFSFQVMGLNDIEMNRSDTVGSEFMKYLSYGRVETLDETVKATKQLVLPFSQVTGYLTGVKQRLEKNIKGIQRVEQIDELEEHIERWKNEPLLPQ